MIIVLSSFLWLLSIAMAKLTIRRKGHTRKAFTTKRGGKKVKVDKARVKPSIFKTSDRGSRVADLRSSRHSRKVHPEGRVSLIVQMMNRNK